MYDKGLQQLRQLKLTGMANALAQQQEQPGHYEGLSFEQRLQLLTDAEHLERNQRKQQRLLKAELKLHATGQAIDYSHPRGLKQGQMASLPCQWVHKAQNLLLTGPCMCSGPYACMKGYSAKYYRLSRLILDDWGLEPLDTAQRNDLMEIMDDRNGTTSTVVISQLPINQWYQFIGDNTLADAILDRLIHNAHRIELKGESMRKSTSELTDREHLG